ncbi:MAG: amino acid ABC transporter ATP-binding protein [Actinobacteria bacterium ATB1]|nr:amino acid ABC transporter ATP-binding protein [Actinobacteria bacterium ATB1]
MTQDPAKTNGTNASDAIVVLEHVHKWFGDLHVLDDVGLSVALGETVVLIGPSGAGKSTLIRCVNRLERHDSGHIRVCGREMTDASKDVQEIRRETGMVFQQFNLFQNMTVLENVTYAQRAILNRSKEQAEAVALGQLERVGTRDLSGKYPAQLSGGEQQRVAMARALAMDPKVMLFDEPTSALDPETTGGVLDVMAALSAEDMTMIVVSHEMSFARSAAHRVGFMADGRILEIAPPGDLFTNPREQRTRHFLDQIV